MWCLWKGPAGQWKCWHFLAVTSGDTLPFPCYSPDQPGDKWQKQLCSSLVLKTDCKRRLPPLLLHTVTSYSLAPGWEQTGTYLCINTSFSGCTTHTSSACLWEAQPPQEAVVTLAVAAGGWVHAQQWHPLQPMRSSTVVKLRVTNPAIITMKRLKGASTSWKKLHCFWFTHKTLSSSIHESS